MIRFLVLLQWLAIAVANVAGAREREGGRGGPRETAVLGWGKEVGEQRRANPEHVVTVIQSCLPKPTPEGRTDGYSDDLSDARTQQREQREDRWRRPRRRVSRQACECRALPGGGRGRRLPPVRRAVRVGYSGRGDRLAAFLPLGDRLRRHRDEAGLEHVRDRAVGAGQRQRRL